MRILKYTAFLLIAMFIIYGGIWYFTANKISNHINAKIADNDGVIVNLSADNLSLGYEMRAQKAQMSGFPFSYEINLVNAEEKIRILDDFTYQAKYSTPVALSYDVFNGAIEINYGTGAESTLNGKALSKMSYNALKLSLVAPQSNNIIANITSPFAIINKVKTEKIITMLPTILANYQALNIHYNNLKYYDNSGEELLFSGDNADISFAFTPSAEINELADLFNMPKELKLKAEEKGTKFSDKIIEYLPNLRLSNGSGDSYVSFKSGAKDLEKIYDHNFIAKLDILSQRELCEAKYKLNLNYQPISTEAQLPSATSLNIDYLLMPKDGFVNNILMASFEGEKTATKNTAEFFESYGANTIANIVRNREKNDHWFFLKMAQSYKSITEVFELERLDKAPSRLVFDGDLELNENGGARADLRQFELNLADLFVAKLNGKALLHEDSKDSSINGLFELEKTAGLIDLAGRYLFVLMKDTPDYASLEKFNKAALDAMQKISNNPEESGDKLAFTIEVDMNNPLTAKFGSQSALAVPGILQKSLEDAGVKL